MIAYNKICLDNLRVQREADKAYNEECINKEEMEGIKKSYPVCFYMPNPFVRVGLFVLTIIIASFSLGFFSLLFLSSYFEGFGALAIFFGLLSYGALEFMVNKNHYKSGVDDALLWISPAFIVGGLNVTTNISALGNAVIIFFIAMYFSLRFTDMLMSTAACIALLAQVFYTYIKLGPTAKATTPFLIMIVSGLIYLFIKEQFKKERWGHYANSFTLVSVTALICFYIAGNYYVVREVSIAMFNLELKEGESIPFGWLFWIVTVAIPLAYIYRGVQKKDIILIRVGLLLVAAMIFTIRHYYHIISIEVVITIGGSILIGIAYALIKYLNEPKYGFTYREETEKLFIDKLQIEAMIIAETLNRPEGPEIGHTNFGGGSGGGGGATGDFK